NTIGIGFADMYKLNDQHLALFDFYFDFFAYFHAEEEGWCIKYRNISEIMYAFDPVSKDFWIETVRADGFFCNRCFQFCKFSFYFLKINRRKSIAGTAF